MNMGYFILRKKDMLLLIACVCTVLVFAIFGAQQVAINVSKSFKSLPIYSVNTQNKEKTVSLGINCAWGDQDIPQILDILEQKQVKATFFIVGDWCDRYPNRVKEIFESGHEIANHSDTHADMTKLSKDDIKKEIENCSKKLEGITKQKVQLFRCPSGAYNDLVINTIKDLGYYPIQWSLDTLDWKDTTPQQMIDRVVPNLTYGDILLLHNDTKYTKDAIGMIIDSIKEKGYKFKKVGELIHKDKYSVDVTGRQFKE